MGKYIIILLHLTYYYFNFETCSRKKFKNVGSANSGGRAERVEYSENKRFETNKKNRVTLDALFQKKVEKFVTESEGRQAILHCVLYSQSSAVRNPSISSPTLQYYFLGKASKLLENNIWSIYLLCRHKYNGGK